MKNFITYHVNLTTQLRCCMCGGPVFGSSHMVDGTLILHMMPCARCFKEEYLAGEASGKGEHSGILGYFEKLKSIGGQSKD